MMSVPVVVWLVIFSYIPLWGWVIAFFNYKPGVPWNELDFVGFKYFVQLFNDPRFYNALLNTISMSFLNVIFACTLCPIIFAIFINEVRNIQFKRTVQTISYLPHFVSWVVVAGMVLNLLSVESGIINQILLKIKIISEPVNFIAKPDYFYIIVTVATVWKELGWNAIIYIAAMSGIDAELYEAAAADGAGRLRRIWHITLPGIRSTIIVLLIMNIGGLVGGGFEKQFLLMNPLNMNRAEVLDLYSLKYGLQQFRFSFGTSVGIFSSVVSLILVITANKIAKKWSGEGVM